MMVIFRRFLKLMCVAMVLGVLVRGGQAASFQANSPAKAPAAPRVPAAQAAAPAAAAGVPSDSMLADTREQLLSLLRMSPILTQVVQTDPSVLADQEYIGRSNPALAEFLAQHPEVTRNPDFYLFANFPQQRGRNVSPLRRRVGEGNYNDTRNEDADSRRRFMLNVLQIPAFLAVIAMLFWLIRILLENRRWSRVFRMQTEVHSKLLERFSNSEELLHYMESEPGKRFLEAAPIPVEFGRDQRLPGGLTRVLGPLQIGIVLTLLGVGLLLLQRSRSLAEVSAGLLVVGMVTIMPGIGFIISALISWRISAQLGLLPQRPTASSESTDRQ
jgi:hypothetical protein